ncbi:MAG TPA: hypothetical protein VMC86_00005 [Gemmatimonadales bacterium]|nr:hypothetical protein [Gemmatimonadales bacterium]
MHRRLARVLADEAGLVLSGFRTTRDLAVFSAINREQEDVGYLAKGWGDPGFRIGGTLTVPEGISLLWAGAKIRRFRAVHGMGVTFDQRGDTTEVQVDGVINLEGFTGRTMLRTVESLDECLRKIVELTARQ